MDNDRISALERENASIKKQVAKLTDKLLSLESRRSNDVFNGQLNLHFLFNTLNFLYNKTARDKPDVADVILSLSDVLRYTINPVNGSRFALLSDEIEHAEKLIALYNLRMGGKECIRIKTNGAFDDVKFPAPVLLILLDTIFKFGSLTPENPAEIYIYEENNVVKVESNHLCNQHSVYPDEKRKEIFQLIRKNIHWGYKNKGRFKQRKINDFQHVEIEVDLNMTVNKRAS